MSTGSLCFLLFAVVQGAKGTAMVACGHIPILKAPAGQGSFSGIIYLPTMISHLCQLSAANHLLVFCVNSCQLSQAD